MLETLSTTQMLAAFIGLYMVAGGIGLLTDRDSYATVIDDMRENTTLGFLAGLVVFMLGAVIVAIHNVWSAPLAIAVLLVGWGALTEGVLMLAFRRSFLRVVSLIPFTSSTMVPFGIFAIALGAWLLWASLA